MNLELHVVIIIHRVRTKPSAAEITAATAAAAAVAASDKATNEDCSLCITEHSTLVKLLVVLQKFVSLTS